MSDTQESFSVDNSLTAVEGTEITQEEEGTEEPPAKKKKPSEQRAESPYPFAKLRGIRIFSEREINGQDAEMTRGYWKFWNMTAEELCSDGAYNDWGKRDLKLYIDAAWVMHKTHLHELREREVRESVKELQERYGPSELPVKLRTEDENVTELLAQLQDSTANLTELNGELSKSRGKLFNLKQRPTSASYTQEKKENEIAEMSKTISEKEKNLYDGMADVKKDQDSMKKALTRLGNIIEKTKRNCLPIPSVILDQDLQTVEATIITT